MLIECINEGLVSLCNVILHSTEVHFCIMWLLVDLWGCCKATAWQTWSSRFVVFYLWSSRSSISCSAAEYFCGSIYCVLQNWQNCNCAPY